MAFAVSEAVEETLAQRIVTGRSTLVAERAGLDQRPGASRDDSDRFAGGQACPQEADRSSFIPSWLG
jgi:hypothetical protein